MTDFEGTKPQPLPEIKENLKPNLEDKVFPHQPMDTDQTGGLNPIIGGAFIDKPYKITKEVLEKGEINHFIDKNGFIGKDGNTYKTPEALAAADEAWRRRNLGFIGRDGKTYETPEALAAADGEWMQKHNKYRGMDGKDYSTADELAAADEAYLIGQKQ